MFTSKLSFFLSGLLILTSATWATVATAQESDQMFSVYTPTGGLFGTYATQQQAEAAIRTIPGPSNAADAYQYVTEIKGQSVTVDGQTTITYWMGKKDRTFIFYGTGGLSAETEDELNVLMVASFNAGESPPCSSSYFSRTSDWYPNPYVQGYDGFDLADYSYGGETYDDIDGSCSPYASTFQAMRASICPNPYLYWKNSQNACVNEEITATIVTSQTQCDGAAGGPSGFVGNPCDVKTGEKFETEEDFNLGWIALSRYYHSRVANVSGGLGLGWSDSHQIHLAISSSSVGLVEGSGYVLPFQAVSGGYRAADGSGERLIQIGDQWRLYRQDAIYTFDQLGHVISRENQDGAVLSYSYDAYGRRSSITSLQGRSVEFQYTDASSDALITGISSAGVQLVTYTYDNGRLKTVTYPDGGQRIYHYEDTRFPRHLTGITAEDGQRFSIFAYDAKGRVISSQHSGGADGVTLSYSSTGTLVTDALGEQTTYTLTDAGGGTPKVSAIANSAGTASYAYYDQATDFRRRLDTSTDRNGTVTKHIYTETTESGVAMNVQTVQEAFGLPGQRTSISRTLADSNRTFSVESDAQLTSYTRNARLQPIAITVTDLDSQASRATTVTYCEAADVSASGGTCPILGLVKSIDGPRTDVSDLTQYAYYPADGAGCATGGNCAYRRGDLWKVTNALGQVTETLAYDAAGRTLSVKDANGVVTDYSYSPRGWLTATKVRGADSSTESDDRITTIDYWPTGLVKQVTQTDGALTAYTYDAAHRLTDIADNAGNTIHYTLDNAGNRLKEDTKDANGTLKRTLSRVYNQLGQLATQADAVGNPTDYGYDANGNTTSATDALSRFTQSEYDPLNRLKRTLQDVGGIAAETKFAYDALGRLTEVNDPKGLKTTYTYNGLGDLTQQVSPDTGTTTYTYDSAGNRVTQTDAENRAATYVYDALNRLAGINRATPALDVAYTYDVTEDVCSVDETFSTGRLTKMQDGSGTTQYCYNRFGDLTRKVQTVNGVALTLRYSYAPGGQLTAMTYPDGVVVDYVRDSQGRITEVGVTPNAGARQVLLTGATYHPFGPAAGWTYGNGRQMTRTLDLDYRPAAIHDASTGGLAVGFNYDEVGNLLELTQPGSTLPQVGLGYDTLGRLTQFKDGPTGTVIDGYGYDKTGNRISLTTAAGTSTYSYPTTSHRLTNVGGIARTYDAAGNTTGINGTAKQFVYDDTGRMSSVKAGGTTTRNYKYNGKGERVRSYLSTANTYTLYDEAGHWVGDYGANGTPVQQAIWMDDLPVGLRTAAAGTVSYIEPDHLGSPRVVIDPVANTAIWKWDIKGEAFGATAPDQDPDGNGTAFNLDMRFPGQRYDQYAELNYNYFRDYEPDSGRYVQSDPIGLSGGISTYSYAAANPLVMADATGLAAGDRYRSADVAAANALADVLGISIASDLEYAGWVYRRSDGFYTYTTGKRGLTHHSNPGQRPSGALGVYHTHGAESGPEWGDETFSRTDLQSINYGDSAWLATPSGRILKAGTVGNPYEISPASSNNADAVTTCGGSNFTFAEKVIRYFGGGK
ncbi:MULTISPECIES: RHS repeat-associated core domain-containing protein [Pseudoxanthomonas]|nr:MULTISPECIES: DUF4329 domain-containing protein [Pseudoxanthomonas]UAY74973.1 DUF4329 domain-containing protein [Pseudoxanthomonas sp. X-1]